jgi:hypothetical protein
MALAFKTGPMRDVGGDTDSLSSQWAPSHTAKQSNAQFEPSAEKAVLMKICQQRLVALDGKGTFADSDKEERLVTAKGWAAVLQATWRCVREDCKGQGYDFGLIWAILSRLLMDVFGEGGLRRLRAVVGNTETKQYEKEWKPMYGALGPSNRFTQVKDRALQQQLRTICATYNMLWKVVGQGGKLKKKDRSKSFKEEQLVRMFSARFVRELKVLKKSVETAKEEEHNTPVVRAMLQVARPVKVVMKGKKPRKTVNKKATFDNTLQKMLLGAAEGVEGKGHEGERWLASGRPKFEGEVWNLLLVMGGGAMVSMARWEWVEKQ